MILVDKFLRVLNWIALILFSAFCAVCVDANIIKYLHIHSILIFPIATCLVFYAFDQIFFRGAVWAGTQKGRK